MVEKVRRSTKRVVVEMELVKEEYNECSETGAFGELKTNLASRAPFTGLMALDSLPSPSSCDDIRDF
jgi:hypothetical protein